MLHTMQKSSRRLCLSTCRWRMPRKHSKNLRRSRRCTSLARTKRTQRSQLHLEGRDTCPLHKTRSRPRIACCCRRPPDKLCNWMNSCSPKRRSSFHGRTTRSSSLSRRGPWSLQHTSPLGIPRSPCCLAGCRSRGRTRSSLWRPTSQCTTRQDSSYTCLPQMSTSNSLPGTPCTRWTCLRRSHSQTGLRCTPRSQWRQGRQRTIRPRTRCTTRTH